MVSGSTLELRDISGNGQWPLLKRMVTIGKDSTSDIVIDDKRAPAHIAYLLYSQGGYTLHSLTPSYPVLINDTKIADPVILVPGAAIRIGQTIFKYDSIQSAPPDDAGEEIGAFIDAMTLFFRFGSPDTQIDLLAAISRLLHSDGARLVSHLPDNSFQTLATFPLSSQKDRFSQRALQWALSQKQTILMHETDWSEEVNSSLEYNRIGSILCMPIISGETIKGFLYLDRFDTGNPFTKKEQLILEKVRPVFMEVIALHEQNALQKSLIRGLQEQLSQGEQSLIFASQEMTTAVTLCKKFATTDSSVLLYGETGTGKELFARLLYTHSNRRDKPYCALNCGAVPETLMDAELFGHEKGAFTGANQRKAGLFERAQGGTVFLDEIGELPLLLQVKLLRVLQEKEVLPLGAQKPIPADVRIIAATNRNLEQEISQGRFRSDLYFRLKVLNVDIPALRKRGEDILLLADFFLSKYALSFNCPNKRFSPSAKSKLLSYGWPGNVRELQNVIQKAILVAPGKELLPEHLEFQSSPDSQAADRAIIPLKEARAAFDQNYISEVLQKTHGNISQSAKLLDVDRTWLIKLIKSCNINNDEFRNYI